MNAIAEIKKAPAAQLLKDAYNRPIRDLRVSLTDRCNFRCFYCLPHGEPPIAPKEQMLSYEEVEYVCEIFVELGIEKIRLTGGEPMMRQDIETIIAKLAKLKSKGLTDLALTTNGYFLPDRAQGLKASGQHPDLGAASSAPGKRPVWTQHGRSAGVRLHELTALPVRLACAQFPEARPAWRKFNASV